MARSGVVVPVTASSLATRRSNPSSSLNASAPSGNYVDHGADMIVVKPRLTRATEGDDAQPSREG